MNYKINDKLAQAVLQYLAQRPYGEVFQLINALQSLEKDEPKQDENDRARA